MEKEKGENMEEKKEGSQIERIVECTTIFTETGIDFWFDGTWCKALEKKSDQWLERYGLKLKETE